MMIHIITPSVKLKFGHFDFKPANQDFLKEPDFLSKLIREHIYKTLGTSVI